MEEGRGAHNHPRHHHHHVRLPPKGSECHKAALADSRPFMSSIASCDCLTNYTIVKQAEREEW